MLHGTKAKISFDAMNSQEFRKSNDINYLLTYIIHNMDVVKSFDLNVFDFLQKKHFLNLQDRINIVNLNFIQVF